MLLINSLAHHHQGIRPRIGTAAAPLCQQQRQASSVIGTPEWQKAAVKDLGKGATITIQDLVWKSPEGIEVTPVYTKDDLPKDLPPPPGLFPYTRGVRATM